MALIKDFESPNTGLIVKNAYHVIGDIQITKRTCPISVGKNSNDPLEGSPGYVALIFIHIFNSKEARDNQKSPIQYINSAMPECRSINLKFSYDPESSDSMLTQAYNHLKTTEYYKNAIEV